jgi:RNA polymerase sigma-70 factor (ECF subfamily)
LGPVKADAGDDELATAAARGDQRALDTLLRRHASMIHAVCRRVLTNADDALDAAQNAMVAIARHIDTFDRRARFSTWCYRIATNAALDEARRRSRRPAPVEIVPEPRTDAVNVDETVADRIDVDAALARLSPDQRAAVALRDLLGLDYAEIAAVLEIPPGTVRSRIARGRAALAELIGGGEAGAGGNPAPDSEHPTSRAP